MVILFAINISCIKQPQSLNLTMGVTQVNADGIFYIV